MFTVSWFYLYAVGGVIYAGGAYACWRFGALDLSITDERRDFLVVTGFLGGMATLHAVLQFVLPFVG